MSRKEYIGDGVYVQDQGFQLHLFTDYGSGPVEEIFLDDTVLHNLFRFIEFNRNVKITVQKLPEPAPEAESQTL